MYMHKEVYQLLIDNSNLFHSYNTKAKLHLIRGTHWKDEAFLVWQVGDTEKQDSRNGGKNNPGVCI